MLSFAPVPLRGAIKPRLSRIAPLALLPLQPLLQRIVTHITRDLPEVFERLGPHQRSRFLIDAHDLPFVFLLCPDPSRPRLKAFLRGASLAHDARISGSCANLMAMVDGQSDGDALFFSRSLHITGNLEAVVCLRNALDDVEGSVMTRAAALLGPPGRIAWSLVQSRLKRSKLQGSQA